MNRLLNKLNENKMCLIASLPENKYELAKVAWEAGADAIKVHCNVFHNASKNDFGTLDTFKDEFKRIIQDSPVPVGIVAGGSAEAAEEILDQLAKIGFDFVSLYAHDTPASFYNRNDINNFLSFNDTYTFEEIDNILNEGFADIAELSIINKENYGTRLNARDLAKYTKIAKMSDHPCVVPSQKMIYASDIPVLAKTGIKGVMLGAVVYGKEESSIKKTLEEFRSEIDKL